jgi:serine phosphatase RsbU (regulator of sigma subunit)
VVDCTGHGVPGAFMSILANNSLYNTIRDKGLREPAEILNGIDRRIKKIIKQKKDEFNELYGMDMSFCSWEIQGGKIDFQFAGAFHNLVIIKPDGEYKIVKGNRFPVGNYLFNTVEKVFQQHQVTVESGDTIYLFSDGYATQFGWEENEKFMTSRLIELLSKTTSLKLDEQQKKLEHVFHEWKGDRSQIDDVLVIGVRF